MSYSRYNELRDAVKYFQRDNVVVFTVANWEKKIVPNLLKKGQMAVNKEEFHRLSEYAETQSRLNLVGAATSEALRRNVLDMAGIPDTQHASIKDLAKTAITKPSRAALGLKDVTPKLVLKPAKQGDHICPVCKKYFATSVALQRHQLSHQGARKHTCAKCGYSNTKYVNARKHHAWCVLGKRFSCKVCAKEFASDYNRRRHEEVHTGPKKEMVCHFCKEKKYTVIGSFQSHVRHCPMNPDFQKRGKLKCHLCGAIRTRAGDLTTHMREHGIYVFKPGPEHWLHPEEEGDD